MSTFEFFGMARELRNAVYEELARQNLTRVNLGKGWSATVDSYMEPSLLLVSKQFKSEYEEEVRRNITLDLSLNAWRVEPGERISAVVLPGNLSDYVSHVRFEIVNGEFYEVEAWLEEHSMLLSAFNLPNMQTLDIGVMVTEGMLESWFLGTGDSDMKWFFSCIDGFADACIDTYSGVEVYAGLFVISDLYQALTHQLVDRLDAVTFCHFQDAVCDMPGNLVIHKATPSQLGNPHSFYGLDLEVSACGVFDIESYDALVAQSLAEAEEVDDDDEVAYGSPDGHSISWSVSDEEETEDEEASADAEY